MHIVMSTMFEFLAQLFLFLCGCFLCVPVVFVYIGETCSTLLCQFVVPIWIRVIVYELASYHITLRYIRIFVANTS